MTDLLGVYASHGFETNERRDENRASVVEFVRRTDASLRSAFA